MESYYEIHILNGYSAYLQTETEMNKGRYLDDEAIIEKAISLKLMKESDRNRVEYIETISAEDFQDFSSQ
jgi:hypothetical protein